MTHFSKTDCYGNFLVAPLSQVVNLEFFSMVDVSDVADILEGDSETAQKICEAAKKIALESDGSSPSANDQSEELQDSNNDSEGVESSQEDEVDKESEN